MATVTKQSEVMATPSEVNANFRKLYSSGNDLIFKAIHSQIYLIKNLSIFLCPIHDFFLSRMQRNLTDEIREIEEGVFNPRSADFLKPQEFKMAVP